MKLRAFLHVVVLVQLVMLAPAQAQTPAARARAEVPAAPSHTPAQSEAAPALQQQPTVLLLPNPPPPAQPTPPASPDAPLSVAPELVWQGQKPEFVHAAYFARDAWGPPLAVPPSEQAHQWGRLVWRQGDVWFAIETSGVPDRRKLCVSWLDPRGNTYFEECQTIPEGSARLSFKSPRNRSWPEGTYSAKLLVVSQDRGTASPEPADVSDEVGHTGGGTESAVPIADLAFGAGGLAQAAMSAPIHGPGWIPPSPMPSSANTPKFPWPPPRPTSRAPIQRELLAREGDTLGDAADRINAALERAGYGERSFYSVPRGFAVATRLEQIEADGTPKPDPLRWSTSLPPRPLFSLSDFVRALFTAAEGHYRVIVFVITDQTVATASASATEGQVQGWLSGGLDRLPVEIAGVPFGEDYECTALVYEFRKVASEPAPIANPDGAPSAATQLERSGITAALQQ